MSNFVVLAYWGKRPESIDACADRLIQFFGELSNCDMRLKTWFELGDSRIDALRRPVNFSNREFIRGLLESSQHRTDVGNKVVPDLGFLVGLWNGGNDSAEAGATISCGGYTRGLLNSVVLDLPDEFASLAGLAGLQDILAATAKAWSPDWAGVVCDAARESRPFDPFVPFVDWMLYLSHDWLPVVPPLPPSTLTRPFGEGTLIVVQEEATDPTNPEYARSVRAVEDALKAAWHVPRKDHADPDDLLASEA
jgi:hypothetical protein